MGIGTDLEAFGGYYPPQNEEACLSRAPLLFPKIPNSKSYNPKP